MYKNILFDFDGTVFDTVEGIERSVKYALNKNGLDAPLDSLKCFAGPPLRAIFKEKFDLDEDMITKMVAGFQEDYVPRGLYISAPFPGIVELLDELRQNGRKLAITTLKPRSMAVDLLAYNGIPDKFDLICGLHDDPNEKLTKADIVRDAMNRFGSTPEDTVLIGDTKYDVHGGHEAGLKVVGVRYGYAAVGELEEAKADVIVDSVDELRKYLLY